MHTFTTETTAAAVRGGCAPTARQSCPAPSSLMNSRRNLAGLGQVLQSHPLAGNYSEAVVLWQSALVTGSYSIPPVNFRHFSVTP